MSTSASASDGGKITVTQATVYDGPPVRRPEGVPDDMPYVTTDKDGQVVLHDSTALGMIAAVKWANRGAAMHNCGLVYQENADRVDHFRKRLAERGASPADWCMMIADVDDPNGSILADLTMPGYDWGQYRAIGQKPIARGLVERTWLCEAVKVFDPIAADRMMMAEGFIVVVVTSDIARVIDPSNFVLEP